MTGFDPAAEFLLTNSNHESLFEQAHSQDDTLFRCKGCRIIVNRWERKEHWQNHRIALEASEEARKALLVDIRRQNMALAREARERRRELAA